MSEFFDLVDEFLGDDDAISDIRVVVRRLYFYDFLGHPVRIWQGQGKLITEDGSEWWGSMDANGTDHHQAPAVQDGRDGSSATYTFGLQIPDTPGEDALSVFNEIKSQQSLAAGRALRIYLAVFKDGEALRPTTPLLFFRELEMIQPKFSEKLESDDGRRIVRKYSATITAKDGNAGRSRVPNGTYTDTVQKRRALEHDISDDKGCEYVARLANRTFVLR